MGINSRWFIAICLLFISPVIKSQTITGSIQTIDGRKLPSAIVTFKDSVDSKRSSEFSIAKNGEVTHVLKKKYVNLYVEFSANGFKSHTIEIRNPLQDEVYKYSIVLVKDDAINLNEVAIVAKRRAFTIKQDTVDYNVASFRDGSERKIQDLIKKLPGVEVNDKSGEIRYKGKSVETVKLDGDDLFGSNYALGTKNINVDMVEQVQAIENYSDNPLLKGIETGDKVALNLKLKKGKTDLSGTVDIGSGVFNDISAAQNLGATAIEVSKKYKSFATLSYNNIGQVNSPYDYFTNQQSVSQLQQSNLYAQKILTDDFFTSVLDDTRSNINNEFFATYNAMFKIGNKFTVKSNLYVLDDKMQADQLVVNRNFVNGDSIITSDQFKVNKMPNLYRGDIDFKLHTSPSSLLEYSISTHQENVISTSTTIQNSDKLLKINQNSKGFFIKNNLLFTKKLSENTVLQATTIYSFNKIPQILDITPSVVSLANNDIQNAEFRKKFLSASIALLGSGKRLKYNVTSGFIFDISPFTSSLISSELHNLNTQNNFDNNLEFSVKSFYVTGTADYIWRKFKFSPALKLSSLNQLLTDFKRNYSYEKANVVIEPFISISHKFNDKISFVNSAGYSVKPFGEQFLFGNNVLINNRTLTSNTPTLALQKTFNAGSFFMINDLYNQFQLNVGIAYANNMGNFFSNIHVQEQLTQLNNFYLNEDSKFINYNFRIQKYFAGIGSTIRIQTNVSSMQYKNVVNQSDLRNNNSTSFHSELFFKTAFEMPVNFENIIFYNRNISSVNGGNSFANNSINHTFKTIFKSNKQLFLIASTDYFVPNLEKKKQDFLFLDATAKYSPTGKPFSFSITGKNLFNENAFKQFEVNDYSSSSLRSALLERYVLVNVSYSF